MAKANEAEAGNADVSTAAPALSRSIHSSLFSLFRLLAISSGWCSLRQKHLTAVCLLMIKCEEQIKTSPRPKTKDSHIRHRVYNENTENNIVNDKSVT